MNFDFNLSLVIAHSIVYEQNENTPCVAINQGDPSPSSTQDSTASQLQAYTQYLPQLLNTTANQTLPVGQTNQAAQNVLAPEQQQLQDALYGQYAPELYNIGNQLNQQQTQAGLSQALQNINGTGGQLATAQEQMAEQANPQYYAALGQAGNQLGNLLGSINLGGLTGSEEAQVQRSNAQQDAARGIANTPSQTATESNAMNFGTALQAKQANLAQAINTASTFLPNAQTGVNTFATATGQNGTTQSNPGANQFLGVNANNQAIAAASSNSAAGNTAQSNINSTANNQASLLANQRNSLDMVNSTLSSLPT